MSNSTFRITHLSFNVAVYNWGIYGSLEIKGIAPGCKKEDTFTLSPMAGRIWAHGLYSGQQANISPSDYLSLLAAAPTVYDTLTSIRDATPEEVAQKRLEAMILVDTAARFLAEDNPKFKPTFDQVVYHPEKPAIYS